MKYKVGDKVKIKGLDWYEKSRKKDDFGIRCEKNYFTPLMAKFCGRKAVIKSVFNTCYKIDIDGECFNWDDEMLEQPKKKHKNKKNMDNCTKKDLFKKEDPFMEFIGIDPLLGRVYLDILRGENNLKVEIPHFAPNDVKVPKTDAEIFKSITDKMLETFIAKNADYGNSFEKSLDKRGLISAITRMEDKFNRFDSLIEKTAQVKDESIRDTLLDLANYCIMTVMWLDKQEKKKKDLEDKK